MKSPWFSLNHISHLATVEIRVVRLGSFQNLYLSFAIVEITHGVTANRDDTDFHHAKPQIIIIIIKICSEHISTLLGAQGAETKNKLEYKQFTVTTKTILCTEIHEQCNYKYTSSLKNCDIR